jgi:hypothetical protein
MKLSTRGVLIAGATAGVVLIVGVVFVFQAGRAPADSPAVAVAAAGDDSALSLEARRQARLAQSQAMLGGAKFPAEAPVPAPAAAEPPPAPPSPAPAAPPQKTARPAVAPVVEPLPAPPGRPCTESGGSSPVAEACLTGGQPAAKQVMKRLVATARKRGSKFTCEGCHVDLDNYKLREEARADFMTLLEAAK